MVASMSEIIPMKSREIHKFFEPLVLLKALGSATRKTAVSPSLEASIDIEDDEEIFKAFVYKLGHVCDNIKGDCGATITSFCVLQDQAEEDLVHYWFASNQRTHGELETTKTYVKGLLEKANEASEDIEKEKEVFKTLLSNVLSFNRPRVTYYIKQIIAQASKCISICLSSVDEKNQAIAVILRALANLVDLEPLVNSSDQSFVEKCHQIILMLERIQVSSSGRVMTERALEGRMLGVPSEDCWSDLQHMINRTLAYSQSVRFMLRAKRKWPVLFERFDVSFYESSERMPRPSRNKSQSAQGIVGRMTRKQEIIEIFRDFVRDLQIFDLDKLIQEEYKRDTFHPIVHSEVLLLDQLDKQGLLQNHFFFNGWMYIGSSKPTCKLCDYYFEAHPSHIRRRPTHGNLYISWRFPDVLSTQGEKGVQRRQDILDKMLRKVRKEAFDIVRMKTPSSYRGEDSFTYSAVLPVDRSTDRGSDGDVDDLASLMGQVDLDRDL